MKLKITITGSKVQERSGAFGKIWPCEITLSGMLVWRKILRFSRANRES